MWLKYDLNEYGTEVSVHNCEDCGTTFTICPAHPEDAPDWGGCLGTTCTSYAIKRDAMFLFGQGKVKRRALQQNPKTSAIQ